MKIEFDPATDNPKDAAEFVQDCLAKGLLVLVSTQKPHGKTDKALGNGVLIPPAATTTKGEPRKRAPNVTHEIYEQIKNGNPEITRLYSEAIVGQVMNTKSWNAYLSRKRKARLSKSEM